MFQESNIRPFRIKNTQPIKHNSLDFDMKEHKLIYLGNNLLHCSMNLRFSTSNRALSLLVYVISV